MKIHGQPGDLSFAVRDQLGVNLKIQGAVLESVVLGQVRLESAGLVVTEVYLSFQDGLNLALEAGFVTEADLAREFGASQSIVERWRSGQNKPLDSGLRPVATFLETACKDLIQVIHWFGHVYDTEVLAEFFDTLFDAILKDAIADRFRPETVVAVAKILAKDHGALRALPINVLVAVLTVTLPWPSQTRDGLFQIVEDRIEAEYGVERAKRVLAGLRRSCA